jgi:hypothetical protein
MNLWRFRVVLTFNFCHVACRDSTIALLLALGEMLETPFRVMDEFDVFVSHGVCVVDNRAPI